MPRRIRYALEARADIAEILDWTTRHFGYSQRKKYRALINEAIAEIAHDPLTIRSRSVGDVSQGIRLIPLARIGRAASHYVVYEVVDEDHVVVLKVLHSGRDQRRHLPGSGK